MSRPRIVGRGILLAVCAVLSAAATTAGASTASHFRAKERPLNSHTLFLPLIDRRHEIAHYGLTLRYDFAGWVRGPFIIDMYGVDSGVFDRVVSPDLLRVTWRRTFILNPFGWPDQSWSTTYSLSRFDAVSSTAPKDPAWKWSNPLFMPESWHMFDGAEVFVGGQPFRVAGPLRGDSGLGAQRRYWQLTNTQQFLYFEEAGFDLQYALPGDVVLRYDADGRWIQTYESVKRTFFANGRPTGETVQFVFQLSTYAARGSTPPSAQRASQTSPPLSHGSPDRRSLPPR